MDTTTGSTPLVTLYGAVESPKYSKPVNEQSKEKVYGDYTKFVYNVPPWFDKWFEKFDDRIIALCQRWPNPIFKIFSTIMTVFTTIEFGIAAPLFFFLANMDAIAVPILYIMLALSIITQIPKRFLFRKRPYMQGRAKCLAKDHTSSFPSRAVTCGAIYGFFIGIVFQETLQPEWWFHFYSTVPITIFLVLASAFGRIYLGVHFPSDCLFSLVQAGISIGVGIGAYYLQSLLCNYCGDGSCYGREHIVLDENVAHVNWYLFAIASVTWLIIAVLSSIKPLEFYVKFHHVFGLLLPCLTFQWVFLCPGLSLNGKTALEHPDDPQWYSWIVSIVYISFMTLFGMKAKKISIIAFIIIYSLTLALLVLWRGYYM